MLLSYQGVGRSTKFLKLFISIKSLQTMILFMICISNVFCLAFDVIQYSWFSIALMELYQPFIIFALHFYRSCFEYDKLGRNQLLKVIFNQFFPYRLPSWKLTTILSPRDSGTPAPGNEKRSKFQHAFLFLISEPKNK